MPDVYRKTLDGVGPNELRQLASRFAQRYPFLLTCVEHTRGAHDLLLLADEARLTLHYDGERFFLNGTGDARAFARDVDFCAALDHWFAAEAVNDDAPCQNDATAFIGGWFLYLGYELAAQLEPSLRLPVATDLPVAVACRSRAAIIVPHDSDAPVQLVTEDAPDDIISQLQTDLRSLRLPVANECRATGAATDGAVPTTSEAAFKAAVVTAKSAISNGEVYQANLSREWQAPAGDRTAGALFEALCQSNPSPFAALAHLDKMQIISSSPERLVQVSNRRVTTRPIAGTRPRGANAREDDRLIAELLAHPKERAEHVMLIDLERNDLGRVCVPGSVCVDEYMVIESYRHVHHIVSNIVGDLADDASPGDVIAAVFPGGTITGCPKVRCMQLIGDLEQRARGAYTGSLGYLSRNGDMDLNILIRTLTLAAGKLRFSAGAGIVADSDPQAELQETAAKAQGMLSAYQAVYRCAG